MYAVPVKQIENVSRFSRLICTGKLTLSICATECLIRKSELSIENRRKGGGGKKKKIKINRDVFHSFSSRKRSMKYPFTPIILGLSIADYESKGIQYIQI